MKSMLVCGVSLVLMASAAADDCVTTSVMIGLFSGQLVAAEAAIEAQSIEYAALVAEGGSCEADAVATLRTEIEEGLGMAGVIVSIADDEAFAGCAARESFLPIIEKARITQTNLLGAWQRLSIPSVAEVTRLGCAAAEDTPPETNKKKTKVK